VSSVERPSRDETLMALAMVWARRGTCGRLQVGAVVSREGRSLVSGYNGAPAGLPHCVHDPEDSGGCDVSMHAEANAIAYAARHGVRLEGAEMHCTDSPCLSCARLIINAGINRLVYAREYRITDGVRLLQQAGLTVEFLPNMMDPC